MSFRLELVTGRPTTTASRSKVLRPSAPHDAPRLVTMFERCSPESRYGRFLAPLQHFPASHLVDVVRSSPIRRSWVVDDLETGHVVAVGSWFRNQSDTTSSSSSSSPSSSSSSASGAELGLLVEDAFQRQGHGTALLDVLTASARHAGITELVGHTLADSRHVHRMLRRLGPSTLDCRGITCTVHVSLVDDVDTLAG